jgi:very-short-patch-repair endonuclease
MTLRRPFISYRGSLKRRAQSLRRDPTPAEHQLVIELDGDSHYTDGAQRYDNTRTGALTVQGLRVLRFTNTEGIQNFEAVCAAVLRALNEEPQPTNTP